ncbi:hypothetical protein EDD21DRAFT_353754 [Dissophora ornata]|nr:hypothetical protein BGZ58_000166 [Dissophora ornata]KAI8601338.1 hypothetical protein EDD21DRAFT_353754 [Dissophora ornata]
MITPLDALLDEPVKNLHFFGVIAEIHPPYLGTAPNLAQMFTARVLIHDAENTSIKRPCFFYASDRKKLDNYKVGDTVEIEGAQYQMCGHGAFAIHVPFDNAVL